MTLKTKFLALLLAGGLAMPAAVASANEYGAIAYSPMTGSHGYSHNFPSRRQAERVAMNNCLGYAGDCRVVVYFYNACGALAVGRGNGWGHAYAPNRRQAERQALAFCRANTSGCQVVRWVCSK